MAAMNCISLNCRGTRNAATVSELGVLQRLHQAKFMFLSETRQSCDQMHHLHLCLRLKGFTGASSDGFSGGLALFWHESVEVEVNDANGRYIAIWMLISPDDPMFHATFVYGKPRTENRHRMWSALTDICASCSLPWALIGDFNEALWPYVQYLELNRRWLRSVTACKYVVRKIFGSTDSRAGP
jgi:hypothetical protein